MRHPSMGISRYRYLHYDVFTDRRFGGNQLAVFPDAAGLRAQTMQQIAREIGFAETTFVTAAERPGTDVRMRIFTPGTEMPMAGHPVVGSTFALARDGTNRRRTDRLGLRVEYRPHTRVAGMERAAARFRVDDAAARLSLAARSMISGRSPRRWVLAKRISGPRGCPFSRSRAVCRSCSCRSPRGPLSIGPSRTRVCSTSRPTCLRPIGPARRIRPRRIPGCSRRCSASPKIPRQAGPADRSVRTWCAIRWWTPEHARSILNLQGVKLGRPSWIHISIESSGGAISRVRVGGTSVFVAEGMMDVED